MRPGGYIVDRVALQRQLALALAGLGDLQIPAATLRSYLHPVSLYKGRRVVVTSGFRTSSRPGHDGADMLLALLASDGPQTKPNTDGKGRWWFPSGRSALAIADGVVVHSKEITSGGYLYIRFADGVVGEYLHLAQRLVKAGDRVRRGQAVGIIGPGNSGLVHLHFQLRINGALVDPEPYLAEMPGAPDPRETGWLLWVAVGIGGYYAYRHYRRRRA